MFNLDKFLITTNTINYDIVNDNFYNLTKQVVLNYFSDKKMFIPENFKFFYYDDFIFNTNTSKSNYITLYVEIDQPANEKVILDKKLFKRKLDPKIKELHLTLQNIKDGLFEEYVKNFDANTLLWQEKYSINLSVNEEVDGINVNYLFKVIPCFKYTNENNVDGIIYYDNDFNYIEIEYPLLSIQHLINKDKQTNGLFYNYLISFKNMFMQQKKEENLTFEVFETILYNVPNEIFVDDTQKTLVNIINFLRNKNLKEYKTIDEQDFAYTSKYKSFSILYAKHAINTLEKVIKKLI